MGSTSPSPTLSQKSPVDALPELLERGGVTNDVLHGELTSGNHGDCLWPHFWPQMPSNNGQFLCITYDAPIASDISAKNRKLNKPAHPCQHAQALFDRWSSSSGFNINITTKSSPM